MNGSPNVSLPTTETLIRVQQRVPSSVWEESGDPTTCFAVGTDPTGGGQCLARATFKVSVDLAYCPTIPHILISVLRGLPSHLRRRGTLRCTLPSLRRRGCPSCLRLSHPSVTLRVGPPLAPCPTPHQVFFVVRQPHPVSLTGRAPPGVWSSRSGMAGRRPGVGTK